jgi:hypothetical protein
VQSKVEQAFTEEFKNEVQGQLEHALQSLWNLLRCASQGPG